MSIVQRKHISETGKLLLPVFTSKSEMLDYLGDNKEQIHIEKINAKKEADAFGVRTTPNTDLSFTNKASGNINPDVVSELKLKLAINATNLYDTHGDVHIPGLWKKNLKENPPKFLLQEHSMTFDHRISTEIKAYTEVISFKALGYSKYKGDSEVLVFDAIAKKRMNPFMFDTYALGEVTNHSVGMRYVNLLFAVNSDSKEWKEEKDNWDKYYPMIANQKDVDQFGYFWPVLEAKAIEGSAVVAGSCWTTPTMSTEAIKGEPPVSTHKQNQPEPPAGTRKHIFL